MVNLSLRIPWKKKMNEKSSFFFTTVLHALSIPHEKFQSTTPKKMSAMARFEAFSASARNIFISV